MDHDTVPYDIIVLGEYFFDQIFSGLPRFPKLGCEVYCQELITTGGAMYITATALQRLGVRVGWPAHFGSDYYSRFVYDLAVREGIDMGLVRRLERPFRRVTSAMPFQGERAFVTFADPDIEDRDAYWLQIAGTAHYRHLHLGSLTPMERLQPLATAVHTRGATISMDCQDHPLLETPAACRELLPLVDIFLPNAREARIVSEKEDLSEALEVLMPLCPLVVVKDGANGVWIGHKGQISHVPGIDAGPAVDTTGAGDCFNGGFLFGRVVEKAPLEICARYGNICGGLSVTGVGGATTAPDLNTLRQWMATEA